MFPYIYKVLSSSDYVYFQHSNALFLHSKLNFSEQYCMGTLLLTKSLSTCSMLQMDIRHDDGDQDGRAGMRLAAMQCVQATGSNTGA